MVLYMGGGAMYNSIVPFHYVLLVDDNDAVLYIYIYRGSMYNSILSFNYVLLADDNDATLYTGGNAPVFDEYRCFSNKLSRGPFVRFVSV